MDEPDTDSERPKGENSVPAALGRGHNRFRQANG